MTLLIALTREVLRLLSNRKTDNEVEEDEHLFI